MKFREEKSGIGDMEQIENGDTTQTEYDETAQTAQIENNEIEYLFSGNEEYKNSKRKFHIKDFGILCKNKLINMPIGKRMNLAFLYVGGIALIIIFIGLINMKSIEYKINNFYEGPYKIEENVLRAQLAMSKIEKDVYGAYITKEEKLCTKYINDSELEYLVIEQSITNLRVAMTQMNHADLQKIIELEGELKKGTRYRNQIIESAAVFDQEKIYSIYRNDYAPIFNHIITLLSETEKASILYGQDYIKQAERSVNFSIILFAMIILFAVISCIYLLKKTEQSITKPIEEIQAAMVEFSKGNLDVNIDYEAADEVGVLCEAVRKSSNKLKDYISNITGVIKQLEEKDMTVRVAINYEGDFKPIQMSLDNIVMSFHNMIGVFDETSEQIAIGAEKIAKTSKDVAYGGSEQAREIGNLVERIDQIASKVNMNAKNAEDVKQLSQQSVSVAQMGNEQMKVLNNAMESIAKHSNKISDIIQVIHNIAKQTNLLSLNATIEAARAGNAGKGFAVVAGEIKKLAEECSSAVKFTSELIENSINAMKEGVVLTEEVSKYFDEIVHESMKTNDVIEIMSAYSKEQAEKLTDTLSYLQNISLIIESNSVAAQESSAMSSEFIAKSEKLEDLIHEYKLIS